MTVTLKEILFVGDKYFFDCTNALFEKILSPSVKRALQAPSLSSFMFSNCDKEPQIRANSQREPVSDALERHHATGGRCCDALQNLSDRLLQTKQQALKLLQSEREQDKDEALSQTHAAHVSL